VIENGRPWKDVRKILGKTVKNVKSGKFDY
jgi:hypothetical protein